MTIDQLRARALRGASWASSKPFGLPPTPRPPGVESQTSRTHTFFLPPLQISQTTKTFKTKANTNNLEAPHGIKIKNSQFKLELKDYSFSKLTTSEKPRKGKPGLTATLINSFLGTGGQSK
jgi:hypothetical protein